MFFSPATMLMNRLCCGKKMLVISTAFMIPIILTLFLLTKEILNTIAFTQSEKLGVEYILPLRQLIQHFPEHRGMTNAYLSGKQQFYEKIMSKRQQITQD